MKQTVLFFGISIFLIVYWLIGFVNKLDDDVDVSHGYNEKVSIVNSSGVEVLILDNTPLVKQKELWNKSMLKIDMVELFPNFSEIKYFIDEHIEDDGSFKKKLLLHINTIEDKYISGTITGKKAKVMLSNF